MATQFFYSGKILGFSDHEDLVSSTVVTVLSESVVVHKEVVFLRSNTRRIAAASGHSVVIPVGHFDGEARDPSLWAEPYEELQKSPETP